MRRFLDRVMDYRQSQLDILNDNPNLQTGDVTSVNLTILTVSIEFFFQCNKALFVFMIFALREVCKSTSFHLNS